ncbi:MAG: manganese-dependent inorganic pyrophosphatase [Eggerthellaceae bacterium]|nr:manganese-dependent inorganic pyrophosphatase [Eggerthellaceae bacterium]
MADKVLIVGHKNPDNDAISAAIAMAYFENELARQEGRDVEYEAVRLGPLPPETDWNLEVNGITEPRLIESVGAGDKVILVDHSEYGQAVDGLKDAELVGIVDHHRLGDVTTAAPLYVTMRPWGSSATVVTSIFRQHGIEIPVDIAHVLLSAILTDTVIQKSPTATPHDAMQISYLEEITGKERVSFGQELFRCRGREDEIDIKTYVEADSKEFNVAGKTVLIAQHETVDFEAAMEREEEARKHMQHLIAQHGYDFVLLMVTDILEEGSNFLVEGSHEVVDQVFGVDSSEAVWMPGVLSRKKQVAAPLLEV